jgi:tripartite-type tricarboxylate transporter receptor subunit TctC
MLTAAVLAGACGQSVSADFPEKPVRIVVEFPAGGATDVLIRRVAVKMRERLNQQIIVDNRPGAGGIIAHELVLKSPADGYTLLLGSTALPSNKSLHRKLSYDAGTDFQGVAWLADWGAILAVHPSVPAKTTPELLKLAGARDGQMTYSSAGNGTWPHLAMEMLLHRAGVKMRHIPYKGAVPALTEVIGGFIDAKLDSYVTCMPNIKAGRLRGISVTTATRMSQAPDIPTIAEQGFPGYATAIWSGLLAPRGTPRDPIVRLEAAAMASVQDRDINQQIMNDGMRPVGASGAEMDKLLKSEIALWARVIRDAGVNIGE